MHYTKSIISNLKKSGIVTVFNILGLTVSFAAVMLLTIYLWDEFTFDRFNKNYEQIYRLNLVVDTNGEVEEAFTLPNPMANVISDNIPELQNHCSFAGGPSTFAKETDLSVSYKLNTRAVDSTFADIFTVKIKSGIDSPLKGRKRIIISEKAANRIFGDENPVGKVIMANFKEPYTIDAVFYDLPNNTKFNYEAFCSYPTADWVDSWSEWSFRHFYKIAPETDFEAVSEKILEIPELENYKKDNERKFSFSFTPLKDIHFGKGGNGNLLFVRTLVLVAILLLVMAFINYVNFSIANAPKLIKSVNMRRVVGESKRNLFLVSIFESITLIVISFFIALLLCFVILKFWPNIFGYNIILVNYVSLLFYLLALFIGLGVIASIYPSQIITNVKPALALKGIMSFSAKNSASGKILTVIQYTISIILIVGILFIEKQISYVKNYDLGFEKENILVLQTTPDIREKENAFTSELMKNPNISNYALSQFIPGGVGMGWGRTIDGKQVNFKCWPVDENYLNFMGFEITEGRNFSTNIKADENNFIFNQKAIKEFGWDKSAIGREIPGFDFKGKLVGIIKDVKYASLHEDVEPMAFWLTKTRHNKLSLKINSKNTAETIAYIKKVYSEFETQYPISFQFLDESLDAQYRAEEKQAQLILAFCMISIFISIIGALGLIIFMSKYRIKEIGIRKVNGAKISEILIMLNKDFIKWVTVAFVIATPIAYYAMSKWLENFTHKTTLSWWVFALAGVLALIIALLTVSWQSFKAANTNPVKSLRTE